LKRHERLNQLVEQHLHLVALVCRENKSSVRRIGIDEAKAIGQLALVSASRKWQRNGEFAAYAKVCMVNAIRQSGRSEPSHVSLNGHDPEDQREWFSDGPEVASILTDDEKKFMQHIEDSRMGPSEVHKALAKRRRQSTKLVVERHKRILLRIAEVSNE